jgi:nicotinate-nucleotide adenylyltransferase
MRAQPEVRLPSLEHPLRVGLLGGTFDPVHNGHVEVAETALRWARLDAVYFVTSFDPPHKSGKWLANFLDRHAMVALALINKPRLIPSSMEYERLGKSYSVDTVRQLKNTLGTTSRIFFLIGIDAFLEIGSWKEHSSLPELCRFIIFSRPGFRREDLARRLPEPYPENLLPVSKDGEFQDCDQNWLYLLEDFSSSIASTDIRNQIRLGKSISAFVPDSVAEYIEKTKLYLGEDGS